MATLVVDVAAEHSLVISAMVGSSGNMAEAAKWVPFLTFIPRDANIFLHLCRREIYVSFFPFEDTRHYLLVICS